LFAASVAFRPLPQLPSGYPQDHDEQRLDPRLRISSPNPVEQAIIEAPHVRFGLKSLPALMRGFMLAKWTGRLSILVAITKTAAVSAALVAFAENTAVARGLA